MNVKLRILNTKLNLSQSDVMNKEGISGISVTISKPINVKAGKENVLRFGNHFAFCCSGRRVQGDGRKTVEFHSNISPKTSRMKFVNEVITLKYDARPPLGFRPISSQSRIAALFRVVGNE